MENRNLVVNIIMVLITTENSYTNVGGGPEEQQDGKYDDFLSGNETPSTWKAELSISLSSESECILDTNSRSLMPATKFWNASSTLIPVFALTYNSNLSVSRQTLMNICRRKEWLF